MAKCRPQLCKTDRLAEGDFLCLLAGSPIGKDHVATPAECRRLTKTYFTPDEFGSDDGTGLLVAVQEVDRIEFAEYAEAKMPAGEAAE